MPRGLPVSPEPAAASPAWSKPHLAHMPHCGHFLKNSAPRREILSDLNRLKTTLHLRTLVIFYKTQNTLLHLPPDNRGLNLCHLQSAPEERLRPAPAIPADSPSGRGRCHGTNAQFMAEKSTRRLWAAPVSPRHFWGASWAPHPGCERPMGVSPRAQV